MGLLYPYIQFIESEIIKRYGTLTDITMLELGNQLFFEPELRGKSGKDYFTNLGLIHTSIDLNGKNGSLQYDLSQPIENNEWMNRFNVVTNLGTSEHIEPIDGQYECFKNIHSMTMPTGIMIHGIPTDFAREQGYWYNHCHYYYTLDFLSLLAKQNHYRILSMTMAEGLLLISLKKKLDVPFMPNKKILLSKIKYMPINNIM